MIDTKIPTFKYWKTAYPYLEDRAEGMCIPEVWGKKDNIIPVCINTEQLIYKWQRRASYALRAVRADGELLVENTDYIKDLNASTFTLKGTPFLAGNTTYYFVLSGTYAIDGSNYVQFAGYDGGNYTNGQWYMYNGSSWSDGSADLNFHIYGKTDLSGEEQMMVEWIDWDSGWRPNLELRDHANRTRTAQSFLTPAGDGFYITRIVLYSNIIGSPSGAVQVHIMSSLSPETIVGSASYASNAGDFGGAFSFNQRGTPSKLSVDVDGVVIDSACSENVADIWEDCFVNVLTGGAGNLNTTTLAELAAERTEKVGIVLDSEMTFAAFTEKLEAGSLFKWLPDFGAKFMVRYCDSDYPDEEIIHFKEHQFLSFKSERKWDSVFKKIKILYHENPENKEYEVYEVSSYTAEYAYNTDKTLTLQTFLKDVTGATWLAGQYKTMLEHPQYWITFEVYGDFGTTLLPLSRVKISKDRADYANGTMNGVLFRVFSIDSNPTAGMSKITALLDTQSYG